MERPGRSLINMFVGPGCGTWMELAAGFVGATYRSSGRLASRRNGIIISCGENWGLTLKKLTGAGLSMRVLP